MRKNAQEAALMSEMIHDFNMMGKEGRLLALGYMHGIIAAEQVTASQSLPPVRRGSDENEAGAYQTVL